MDKFRVLVVDDGLSEITAAAAWLHQGADQLPASPEIIPAGSAAEAAAAVTSGVATGTPINAAVVDLGLGPRQPSGLAVLKLLDDAGIPSAVWVNWGDRGGRLMFVYAAFTWYKPVALMPKAKSTPGAARDTAPQDFARNIARISRGESPSPDISSHFRPRQGCAWPFSRVLSSPADLRNWRAFLTYSQTAAIAHHLGIGPGAIDKWLAEKYDEVWKLIDHASVYMEVDDVDIAAPPDRARTRRMDEKREPDRAGSRRKDEKREYVDRKASLVQFARSQSWFFNDPVVIARYTAR